MTNFTWIPFYKELAHALLPMKARQQELVAFLEELRAQGNIVTPTQDRDANGVPFLLKEIDPFTFMGVFNRGITESNRINILAAYKKKFSLASPVPADFAGVPILNNMKSWFVAFAADRGPDDVDRLWRVFELALGKDPLHDKMFLSAFDDALQVRNTNINLTMGLFWIRPDVFLSVDGTLRKHLDIALSPGGLSANWYVKTIDKVKQRNRSFEQLSSDAWEGKPKVSEMERDYGSSVPLQVGHWLVGAYWDDNDPADQTPRFLQEGVWINGFEDKLLDEVRSIKVNDRIAIKSASTQKHNLPFDAGGRTVAKMAIKAIGTVVKNRGDGRVVEVEWDTSFKPKEWFFYTYQPTIWKLKPEEESAKRLIKFVFEGVTQDYAWFLRQWYGETAPSTHTNGVSIAIPYAIDDMTAEGVFLDSSEIALALNRLKTKKNLILQGPPGVGKTFVARKLAYAFMDARDDDRITSLQFHPSYSYDDFVRGYRPTKEAGKFELIDGPFLAACESANEDSDRPHVILIDEINRGNTSHIFGELLMLLEADKRGTKNAVIPLYRRKSEERFAIPENLYVIGTMNTADRSLALVDYALRRRFAFVSLQSKYGSVALDKWFRDRQMNEALRSRIVERMMKLNAHIAQDSQLGVHFQIGHSFFCPRGDNFSGLGMEWFVEIVETEIIPLLDEYWYDAPDKVASAAAQLLAT